MLILFGFLLFLFMFVSVGVLSQTLLMLLDLPSALLILIPLFFFLCITKSGSIIGKYIKVSFKKDYTYTRTELAGICGALRNLVKFILAIGGFGFLCGIIGCLINLERPEMLGPNLAVSLITMLYAVSISVFIFFPTQVWAENKLNALHDN